MSFFSNKDKYKLLKPLVYMHWIIIAMILAYIVWRVVSAFSNLLNP